MPSQEHEGEIKHIATDTNPRPQGGLLTHYHGEKERFVDGEVQLRRDGGDGGHGAGDGRRPLAPFFLGLAAAMEDRLPFLASAKGEANSWLLVALPKLGFSSPYMCLCGALWPSDGWTLDPMALGHL